MIKNIQVLLGVILFSMLLAACSGEDGDPGPKGDPGPAGEKGDAGVAGEDGTNVLHKVGYFDGIVTGTRRDGTPFSEAFKYEYTYDSLHAFEDGEISLWRSLDGSEKADLSVSFSVEDGTKVPNWARFSFFKELSTSDLFIIKATPNFEITEQFVRELSPEQNLTYAFETYSDGTMYFYGSPSSYRLRAHGESVYDVYYGGASGNLESIYDLEQQEFITSGVVFDLYNKLALKFNPDLGALEFYDAISGMPLSEVIPQLAGDELIITNYVHDSATGILSFDFELKISGTITRIRENSTLHDLTIKGTFNSGSKVYKNIVGRTKG